MFDAFLAKATEFCSAEIPFAVAIVVNYEAPVSGKPGDKAIIQSDGTVWGWIGGGCVQPLIIREALKAIEEGSPRLVRIAPSESKEPENGTVHYSMTCHGGGSLQVYVEPVLPKRKLLIFGRSPAAQCLSRLGKTVGYAIAVVAPKASRDKFPDADFVAQEFGMAGMRITPETFIVVATQGEHDQEALEMALQTDARYISFIASHAKAQKVIALLSEKGVPAETLRRIKAPAGLDIGTSVPQEIAVSILAEMIQLQRAGIPHSRSEQDYESNALSSTFTDPVCGMEVDARESSLSSKYKRRLFYFCCASCKQAFDQNPEKFKAELGRRKEEASKPNTALRVQGKQPVKARRPR
jgi:xanthine dehydrogenase accessory factor